MSEGNKLFRGIRPVDWVLAGALTALSVWLMVENVLAADTDVASALAAGTMVHPMSSHSWAMVPVFTLASASVLWWRRSPLGVTGIALAVMVFHDLLFGWVTRCGAGLPLAFVLAYLGAVALERLQALVVLGLTTLLTLAVLVRDSTTGLEPFVLAFPVLLIVFVIGRAVRHRTAMSAELNARTAELQRLRDQRVALEVAGDRARLSSQLDGLLQRRLGQLTAAAEAGPELDPSSARALFESIETDSRDTLDGMREIVGLLRGGDVALAPPPAVAHLDALLARHSGSDTRLTVVGDPRSLPATVELSAYRIVEHLVKVLADQPDSRVEVDVRFGQDALELRVRGPLDRAADVKSAIARARERARFLGGSLDVKVSLGHAYAVAQLPRAGIAATDMAALERIGIALCVLLLVALPTALHGWPTSPRGNLFTALILLAGAALIWWRSHPRVVSVASLGLYLAAVALGGWFPETGFALYSMTFAVLALAWSGRAAWVTALCGLAYLVPFSYLSQSNSWVATLMFTVPPYIAGTVLRLRRETGDQLARRASELEDERQLFAEIALRHERARIASELHDIVGHAISVMVIQAAAGQRLVDTDPARAREAFEAISESARQGTRDLERLVDPHPQVGAEHASAPDLFLVEEVVARASRSGLSVSCRFEGDRDRVPGPAGRLGFRVVQESLTNVLRHAPGADVRIVISVDDREGWLAVQVENDRSTQDLAPFSGTGRGLVGLRERIQRLGGQLSAGPTGRGGWLVEARLPAR